MKFLNSTLFIFLTALLTLQSCKEENLGPALFIESIESVLIVEPGDTLTFQVSAVSGDHPLARIEVGADKSNGEFDYLINETIGGTYFKTSGEYIVPMGAQTIDLIFRVTDTNGSIKDALVDIFVNGAIPLFETEGQILYSRYATTSGNAYNFNNLESMFLSSNPDSALIDLVEKDPFDNDTLSYTFTSRSGKTFVRNNTFNYDEASSFDVKTAYIEGTPTQVISQIAPGDILLFPLDNANLKYGLLKLISIHDEVGTENDRYVFNVKK